MWRISGVVGGRLRRISGVGGDRLRRNSVGNVSIWTGLGFLAEKIILECEVREKRRDGEDDIGLIIRCKPTPVHAISVFITIHHGQTPPQSCHSPPSGALSLEAELVSGGGEEVGGFSGGGGGGRFGVEHELGGRARVFEGESWKALCGGGIRFLNANIEPSAKVWGALLNGATVCGDVELGIFVCYRLFEIEPEYTGNYITTANLFSRAGIWEEAEKVREKMKNLGFKKIPGSSWIETSGGLQSFIAKDVSNERTEEIYGILDRLLTFMREGYIVKDEFDEERICN
ncbi:hypothetical protein RHGRI_011616 [Rhododendron griersonianum]|uniref:Pentatricopeptide repeat-containing protein n=1 Tax=Rhododendron griersonianum TaxID=479676 RepID=A0AAV6KNZ2_9ERIC|nr:hypothetical protein RHGRI_011616 [Rhododendron griersonianum]